MAQAWCPHGFRSRRLISRIGHKPWFDSFRGLIDRTEHEIGSVRTGQPGRPATTHGHSGRPGRHSDRWPSRHRKQGTQKAGGRWIRGRDSEPVGHQITSGPVPQLQRNAHVERDFRGHQELLGRLRSSPGDRNQYLSNLQASLRHTLPRAAWRGAGGGDFAAFVRRFLGCLCKQDYDPGDRKSQPPLLSRRSRESL